jgi:hypothetical protein
MDMCVSCEVRTEVLNIGRYSVYKWLLEGEALKPLCISYKCKSSYTLCLKSTALSNRN